MNNILRLFHHSAHIQGFLYSPFPHSSTHRQPQTRMHTRMLPEHRLSSKRKARCGEMYTEEKALIQLTYVVVRQTCKLVITHCIVTTIKIGWELLSPKFILCLLFLCKNREVISFLNSEAPDWSRSYNRSPKGRLLFSALPWRKWHTSFSACNVQYYFCQWIGQFIQLICL